MIRTAKLSALQSMRQIKVTRSGKYAYLSLMGSLADILANLVVIRFVNKFERRHTKTHPL